MWGRDIRLAEGSSGPKLQSNSISDPGAFPWGVLSAVQAAPPSATSRQGARARWRAAMSCGRQTKLACCRCSPSTAGPGGAQAHHGALLTTRRPSASWPRPCLRHRHRVQQSEAMACSGGSPAWLDGSTMKRGPPPVAEPGVSCSFCTFLAAPPPLSFVMIDRLSTEPIMNARLFQARLSMCSDRNTGCLLQLPEKG